MSPDTRTTSRAIVMTDPPEDQGWFWPNLIRLAILASAITLCILSWRDGHNQGSLEASLELAKVQLATAMDTNRTLKIALERTAGIVVEECAHKLTENGVKKVDCTLRMDEAGVP